MRLDLGDVVIEVNAIAKHRPKAVWHLGKITRSNPADRVPGPSTPRTSLDRMDLFMDLQADKALELTAPTLTDEMENEVPAVPGTVHAYSVDRGDLINLTDNGDGTGSAATTGTLGNAVLHLSSLVPMSDGSTKEFTGDLLLSVVPGDAARVSINTGAVTEVTPDE